MLTHSPLACRVCGAGPGDAPVVGQGRRQVFDLPPIELGAYLLGRQHLPLERAAEAMATCPGPSNTGSVDSAARPPVVMRKTLSKR